MSGKKNPREWGSIRKQTTKSARYQASFIGPDLARHFAPVTFESKMMAERWLGRERDLIEKCAANDEPWQPPATRKLENKAQALSLATYGGQWIEQRKLKPRTRIEYERKFDLYIKPKLGKVAVRDLTPAAIRSWFSSLGTQHLTRNGHAYGLLHAICATAVHDGLLPSNPCHIERAMNPPTKHPVVIPTAVELAALADKIGSDPKNARFRALILISAWCGLRYGEVSELRRKDFDADCEIVSVGRAVTHRRGDDGKWCRIDTPKDGKAATVVIPPHIRSDITAHLDRFTESDSDALLFVPTRR